ncbi:MAG TPA: nitroreductase family protein [Rhodothermia bacterium]|nr:nitroreductase family protein [Rhodothermia bacterium]
MDFREYPIETMRERAVSFRREMGRRRSIRFFSDREVPRDLIEEAVRTASSAPSGANRQPWRFVAVSDPDVKRVIRERAEEEERESYGGRMPDDWLEALKDLGTDWRKPFLETVPWIVVCFAELYGENESGKQKNYYVQESCGIACGLFIAAIHNMGLATLTHTPSPMGFLNQVLERPANERAMMLIVAGYPAPDAVVPDLRRKPLGEIATFR